MVLVSVSVQLHKNTEIFDQQKEKKEEREEEKATEQSHEGN